MLFLPLPLILLSARDHPNKEFREKLWLSLEIWLQEKIPRFCEIYVPLPKVNNNRINLHIHNTQLNCKYKTRREQWLTTYLKNTSI